MITFSTNCYLNEDGRPFFGKPFFTMADVEKHRQLWARDPVTGRLVGRSGSQQGNVQQTNQNVNQQQTPPKQVSSNDDHQIDDQSDSTDLS